MQTDVLIVRDLSDPDELLAKRINAISETADGGLSGFFERIERRRQRLQAQDSEIDRVVAAKLNQHVGVKGGVASRGTR